MSARPRTARMWRWPVVLGLLMASGLISALLSDGWGDAWSWLALGTPVAVMGWFSWRPRAFGTGRDSLPPNPPPP